MIKQITKGVTICVESFFQPEYSKPAKREYMFAYRIKIENDNSFPIKLIRRHWYILDSHSTKRSEIEGNGVGGLQPIILPGDSYSYASGTKLTTGIGQMKGVFQMENQKDKSTFEVIIPTFKLVAPLKMN